MPRSPERPTRVRRRLHNALWHARPFLLAGGVAVLVLVIVAAIRPPPAATTTLWITRGPLTAGSVMLPDDVVRLEIPASALVPDAVTGPAQLDGRRLLVDLPSGYPVNDSVLSRPGLRGVVPPGRVVTTINPSTPGVAALLRPGDRVDLLVAVSDEAGRTGTTAAGAVAAATEQSVPGALPAARVAAHEAIVLPAGLAVTDSSPASPDAATVLLAVTPAEAQTLAALGVWSDILVVLVE